MQVGHTSIQPFAPHGPAWGTYRFGHAVTRAQCPEDRAEKAADAGRQLAAKHGVGFYNANAGEERLFFPEGGTS